MGPTGSNKREIEKPKTKAEKRNVIASDLARAMVLVKVDIQAIRELHGGTPLTNDLAIAIEAMQAAFDFLTT